jgi:hypothetical protein
MKHPDLNIKRITVKENPAFRVRVESWESVSPKGLLAVDIIQECLDDDGAVTESSSYNFHMTRNEIETLCKGLMSI